MDLDGRPTRRPAGTVPIVTGPVVIRSRRRQQSAARAADASPLGTLAFLALAVVGIIGVSAAFSAAVITVLRWVGVL